MSALRLPNLLIIGAMKSGTTGVFLDLCRHPQVFEQLDKEPGALASDEVLSPAGQQAYAAAYVGAKQGQLLVDASTIYAKLPDVPGVADRAAQVLPADFRVVYVVRDPIKRIISHHHHDHIEGKVSANIDEAVRNYPALINYSRYGYQLAPWIEALGQERVRVIRFEDYTADRQGTIAALCQWVGLDAEALPREADTTVHNQSSGKPVVSGFWQAVQHSFVYRQLVRPLISGRARNALQRMLLPATDKQSEPPRPETIAWLRGLLEDEVRQISDYAGRSDLLWEGYGPDSARLEHEPGEPRGTSGSR